MARARDRDSGADAPEEHVTKASAHKPSGGDTVTVACKLPHGLKLRIFEMHPDYENVMGGGKRETEIAVQVGPTITLNGCALARGVVPEYGIIGGFAMTHGVDAEFMETWLKQNKDHPAVVNKLIFAYPKMDMVEGQAREFRTLRSGLEPLVPDTDPRITVGTKNITKIGTESRPTA